MAVVAFLPKTAVQLKHATQFGDLPVTVFFSANTRKPSGNETDADVAKWHERKLTQMRQLLQGSTFPRGPIVVPNVTHTSMVLAPESVRLITGEVLRITQRAPTSP
jgi:hypothetical protein